MYVQKKNFNLISHIYLTRSVKIKSFIKDKDKKMIKNDIISNKQMKAIYIQTIL